MMMKVLLYNLYIYTYTLTHTHKHTHMYIYLHIHTDGFEPGGKRPYNKSTFPKPPPLPPKGFIIL